MDVTLPEQPPVNVSTTISSDGFFTKTIACSTQEGLTKKTPNYIEGVDTVMTKHGLKRTTFDITIIPDVWHNWSKKTKQQTVGLSFYTLRCVCESDQSEGDIPKIGEMPHIRFNWNNLYEAPLYNDIVKPGKHFTFLVLEWLAAYVTLNDKRVTKAEQNNAKRVEMLIAKNQLGADDDTPPISAVPNKWKFRIDPKKASLPTLSPGACHSRDTRIASQAYTTLLFSGLYALPCISSPLSLLVLGGTQDLLSSSSVVAQAYNDQIFKACYGQASVFYEDSPLVDELRSTYTKNRAILDLWFSEGFNHLVKTHASLLFEDGSSMGRFRTLGKLHHKLVNERGCTNAFIADFSVLQSEYARRLANIIEVFCYGATLGAHAWTNTEPYTTEMHLPKLVNHTSITYPDFGFSIYSDKNKSYSPFNASREEIDESERLYLRAAFKANEKGAKTTEWRNFLTPNLRFVLKRTGGQHTYPQSFDQSCHPNLLNVLLASSQIYQYDYKNKLSDQKGLFNDFRFALASENGKSQMADTITLLGYVVEFTKERLHSSHHQKNGKTSPAFDKDSLPNQLFESYGHVDKTIIENLLKLNQTEINPFLREQTRVVKLEDLDTILLTCMGKTVDEKYQAQCNTLQASAFGNVDSFILPLCALFHTQLMYIVSKYMK